MTAASQVNYSKARVGKRYILARERSAGIHEGVLAFDGESEFETVFKILKGEGARESDYTILIVGRKIHLMRPYIGQPEVQTSIASGDKLEFVEAVLAGIMLRGSKRG